ncbi:MAG TPA: LCP family protein [Anaerolineaceae bacterium]|nr:LCP family protein [Anaerolineaceae bacterium]
MKMQSNKKRGCAFSTFLIVLVLLILGVMVGVSLNKIREGQPGFLTNLWITPDKYLDDPYLSNEATRINVPNHVKTILLLGSDYQPEIGFRTDVMLLMAFNTKTNKVNLISFPRDLWVTIPGLGEQRLNVAFPFGDWRLLSDTFVLNFGFRPDHYMMADFEGFKHILDVLGPIDVEVSERMEDASYLDASGWRVVEPGTVTMSQPEVFWYVRARMNSSDIDRNRRAMEVIKAMGKKALKPAHLRYLPGNLRAVKRSIETDMELADFIIYALPLSKYFDENVFTMYRIEYTNVTPGVTEGGASVLFPKFEEIKGILREVLDAN